MCEERIVASRHADRSRREHEVVLALREHRAAHQPREDRYLRDTDRDHDLEDPGAEHRDDPDREQQSGDRQHDVGEPHDHAVDDAAEVTGDRAEDQPDREADRDRDDPDQEREAGAVDDPRELVATLLVDPEPVLGRGSRAARALEAREVADPRILGGDPRREDGDEDEHPDEPEADQRPRVVAQADPRVAPETAAARFERDLTGLDLRNAHDSRILGLRSAYETSTIRLTITNTNAMKRIPPWSTG